jgi:hypothetical protein
MNVLDYIEYDKFIKYKEMGARKLLENIANG